MRRSVWRASALEWASRAAFLAAVVFLINSLTRPYAALEVVVPGDATAGADLIAAVTTGTLEIHDVPADSRFWVRAGLWSMLLISAVVLRLMSRWWERAGRDVHGLLAPGVARPGLGWALVALGTLPSVVQSSGTSAILRATGRADSFAAAPIALGGAWIAGGIALVVLAHYSERPAWMRARRVDAGAGGLAESKQPAN